MKHDELRSIAHNIAGSLASGVGLMIGVYELHVFDEARLSPDGRIAIDFLRGEIAEGIASAELVDAVRLYRKALPDLCKRHGVAEIDFDALKACYFGDLHFTVTTVDRLGRRSDVDYWAHDGVRAKELDREGRVRSVPVRRSKQ